VDSQNQYGRRERRNKKKTIMGFPIRGKREKGGRVESRTVSKGNICGIQKKYSLIKQVTKGPSRSTESKRAK